MPKVELHAKNRRPAALDGEQTISGATVEPKSACMQATTPQPFVGRRTSSQTSQERNSENYSAFMESPALEIPSSSTACSLSFWVPVLETAANFKLASFYSL